MTDIEIKYIKLKDIIVPPIFRNSSPKPLKVQKVRDKFNVDGSLEVMVINKCGYLIDGYISYLIAKENKINMIPVIVSDTKPSRTQLITLSRDRGKRKVTRCYICNRKLYPRDSEFYDGTNEFTIDHKIAKSKGGLNDIDNMKPCCNKCNALKGNFTYSDELKSVIIKELIELGLLNKDGEPNE